MPENPTQNEEELRRQLNAQVQELATHMADRGSDESWQKEIEQQRKPQEQRDRVNVRVNGQSSSPFADLWANIIGTALAHLTTALIGVALLAGLVSVIMIFARTHAVSEMQQPVIPANTRSALAAAAASSDASNNAKTQSQNKNADNDSKKSPSNQIKTDEKVPVKTAPKNAAQPQPGKTQKKPLFPTQTKSAAQKKPLI